MSVRAKLTIFGVLALTTGGAVLVGGFQPDDDAIPVTFHVDWRSGPVRITYGTTSAPQHASSDRPPSWRATVTVRRGDPVTLHAECDHPLCSITSTATIFGWKVTTTHADGVRSAPPTSCTVNTVA